MSELDTITEKSLRSFYQNICSEWCGRENEMVNLYALGHLAKHVQPGTILSELTQIGIESGGPPTRARSRTPGTTRDRPQRFGHLAHSRNDVVESERSAQRAVGGHGVEGKPLSQPCGSRAEPARASARRSLAAPDLSAAGQRGVCWLCVIVENTCNELFEEVGHLD